MKPVIMKYANFLFDLDGTLTDPKIGITRAVAYSLERLGLPEKSLDELEVFIGPPLKTSYQEIFGLDEELCAKAIEHYRVYFSETGILENTKYHGIDEILTDLKCAGRKLYLATSKPHVFARRILVHFELERYFDGVYGSELEGTRSDKADLIRFILATERLDPKESVMVGDRKHDIIGANANGVASIGVGYGYGSELELRGAGCTHFAENLQELSSMCDLLIGGAGQLQTSGKLPNI